MSAKANETNPSKQPAPAPESQGARWAKYGSNVALMIVVAIVLAILVTYIAQAHPLKVDTTRGGVNSLRPQTINVLHDLNSDIKLVSLYSKAAQAAEQSPGAPRPIDKPAMVADLLDSYQSASKHITTEVIDPADKAKLDALQADLDNRYGKGIKDYKDFLSQYDDAAKKLMSAVTGQVDRVNSIVVADKNDEVAPQIQGTLKEMQTSLENSRTDLRRRMAETRPDYRGISNALRGVLSKISGNVKAMLAFFDKNKANPQISQAVRDYITADRPKLEDIQKLADEQSAKIDKLPDLKVDELQSSLDIPNPILVLGPTQWRVISESQVWPENNTARTGMDGKLQPSFAGEQQITAAIIGLTSPKKPKVAILRPGGAPLASPGFPPFQAGGPFSDIADRLRLYNFDVVEKDMSGQWAMQAQMQQQQMAAPEPSWQDIQDAVWLILDTGSPIQGTEPIAPQLLAHLGHGGSAVILCQPGTGGPMEAAGSDPFQSVVREWGIDLHTDLMAVHEQPPAPPATSTDPLQDFLRRPFVWDIRDYGDAELAQPIKNLQSLFLVMSPVTTHDVSGYTIQKLLPLPDAPAAPKSWGEKDYQDLLNNGTAPKFDASKDLPGPLFGGATSEKKGGGRLVVIGDIEFAINQLLEIPDDAIAHSEGRYVARFPGNGELAMNSVFWAAKMDQMIALSPSALQVSRIGNMAPAALNFWRIGLVLVLLPAAVLVSGVGMYFSRKD
ncbi:MAG TPA: hypothetical protein VGI81_21385 [Tepidisphaeraceae bacterium]|jgi:hypothetical protein